MNRPDYPAPRPGAPALPGRVGESRRRQAVCDGPADTYVEVAAFVAPHVGRRAPNATAAACNPASQQLARCTGSLCEAPGPASRVAPYLRAVPYLSL